MYYNGTSPLFIIYNLLVSFTMLKTIISIILITFITSCASLRQTSFEASTNDLSELLYTTDSYIITLPEHRYGSFIDYKNNQVITQNKAYKITPIGDVIIIEMNKKQNLDISIILSQALKRWYSGNSSVNSIYCSDGGTIIIDCTR